MIDVRYLDHTVINNSEIGDVELVVVNISVDMVKETFTLTFLKERVETVFPSKWMTKKDYVDFIKVPYVDKEDQQQVLTDVASILGATIRQVIRDLNMEDKMKINHTNPLQ